MIGAAEAAGLRCRALRGSAARHALFAVRERSTVTVLSVIVAASALANAAVGLSSRSVWILPDEIVYSELAKSIAAGERPSTRGVPVFGWGEVYPTVIAPAWAIFGDPVWAYHAALVLNAVVMSLAAVPAYLLARVFVPRGLSLVVALLTVLVPSMTYTDVVMTENVFYPVFLLAVYAIARAVALPSLGNQALVLLSLGVVVFTRVQGIALLAAYGGAIACATFTTARTERTAYLRRMAPTGVLVLATPLVLLASSVASGKGPWGWLGVRSRTFDDLRPAEIPEWMLYLLGDLVLYTAVAPVAAAALIIGRGLSRRAPAPVLLYAALALPTLLVMLASVSIVSAGLDVDGRENLNERYVFYVVPLLFVGLATWVDVGIRGPGPRAWAALLSCCGLAAAIPIERLEYNASFQSVALLPWLELPVSGLALNALVAASCLFCGAVWLTCRRGATFRLWALLGAWLVVVSVVAIGKSLGPASHFAGAFDGRPANWIDRHVGNADQVPVIWDERSSGPLPDPFEFRVMVTEFFNDRIGDVYRIGPPTYYERFLPTVPVTLRSDGTLGLPNDETVRARYVLVTCRTPVDGRVVATAPGGSLQLVQTGGPVRLSEQPPCTRRNP